MILRGKRKHCAVPRLGTLDILHDRDAPHATNRATTDDPLEQEKQRRVVQGALAALPAPQRVTIELACYGRLSQAEIAARLNEPLGIVKTRLRLGMLKLREVLQASQSG